MTQTNARLVGNSFKLGYRFQRYWDTSMALAFFFAEVGTGLFLISYYFDFLPGMIAGLAVTGTLKPYFHLAHMGVPKKSWRAILRPDRSWISRGALAIVVLIGFGVLYVLDFGVNLEASFGLPAIVGKLAGYVSVAAAVTVMCYQGMAMSDSEAFTLWASILLPVSSFCYALTAGMMVMLVIGWHVLGEEQRALLTNMVLIMLLLDVVIVVGILARAKSKSKGGEFSVELLTKGEYARYFFGLVLILGLVLPVVVLALADGIWVSHMIATLSALAGFLAFRVLLFKTAVFEPLTHDLAARIGLPMAR